MNECMCIGVFVYVMHERMCAWEEWKNMILTLSNMYVKIRGNKQYPFIGVNEKKSSSQAVSSYFPAS